jgi:FtsZ-interacting cell division protein ZipA
MNMTELQTGLIGLGAVAVVAVVAYNKWQEYRHRKLAEQVLNAQHTDVLLDGSGVGETGEGHAHREPEEDFEPQVSMAPGLISPSVVTNNHSGPIPSDERIEPVLRLDLEPREPTVSRQDSAAEPDVEPDVAPESTVTPVSASVAEPAPERLPDAAKIVKESVEPLQLLSPVIDYVASFEAVEPVPAYQILEAQRGTLERIRKPVHWIGYNEFSREWETIANDAGNDYRRIRVGLQMVNRQGSLSENDLSIFCSAMHDLADELMAIAELPPRQPALEKAAKLDEFCASVDIQIGINVISQGQVFPGTKLRALAESAGMVIDCEGRFVRCDDDGNVLYVLLNQEAPGFSVETMKTTNTHGITFLLDVPRVAHGERVFNQMVDLARRFAEVLHGSLVDDNRRPLSEGALEPIRRQVGQYQSVMAAQSLPAGGPLTQRLFS